VRGQAHLFIPRVATETSQPHHHSSNNQHSSWVLTNAGENPFTPKHTAFHPSHLLGSCPVLHCSQIKVCAPFPH